MIQLYFTTCFMLIQKFAIILILVFVVFMIIAIILSVLKEFKNK